ncbi:intein C-terminal splicing region/intein N-terminal splicing region [Actinoplanes derwentensis]|uniref:Intein C-terminal splicing region/intein N-terminal splicing region n=1 Tax=Actinoplanes derwentensis TaxID=113562 RepID=A0A1H2DD37_9ACTN|nr:intein C-terminal splicing region/intein N-terminal splicing region [Actinoplanes derwentensis]
MTVTVTDALKITNTVTFALTVGTPVSVVNPGTRTSTAGTAIPGLSLTADGGTAPYTWTVTGLPTGLTVTASGVISGTPAAATTATVTATVVDAASRTAATTFTWNIAGAVTATDPGAQAGTVGIDTTLPLAAVGGSGDLRWAATGLPTGLNLDPATGVVSGTPTTIGSWTATVTVTDANGGTSKIAIVWTVATAVAAITPSTQTSVAGTEVTLTLSAGGGTAPYAWTATGLPDGLSLGPGTGIVTGTPTDASAGSAVTVIVTDTAGRTDQTSFTWIVELTAPIALTAAPDGVQTVQLSWAAVDGATGYRIYRDGTRLTDTGAVTTLRDSQLDGATTYQYRIAALSSEGLETATSPATTVTTLTTPAAGENYTTCFTSEPRGCTYTVSGPADPMHPDAGRELTDGIHGTLDAGPAWQGRRPNNQYTITVDLGASRSLTEINSSWLQKQSQDVALPLTVAYAFSNDGQNFTDLALITRPYATDADQIKTYRAIGLAETARYVRVTVNGSSGWSLLDEIELRGVITGIQPPLTLTTPAPAPAADQGQQIAALQVTVTESAGPLTWTADGLPPGLSIGRTTGVITGTVRTPGTYTATVTATSVSGRTGRTSFPWVIYAGPATGPVMDSGKVTGFDPAVSSAGVAVLNGFAYTVVGSKVVKYDLAAGAAATALPVAGGDVYSCADAGNGGQARFHTGARVIGTDGSLIYIADTSCGLKAVTPSTGASRTISARFTTESTIAGRYLYTLDTYKQIWRYDLQSGQTTRLFESLSLSGAIAADNDALWVFNNSDVKLYRLAFNGAETKTFPLPNGSVTATRPAGDHIYYTDSRNLLSRISKIDGGLQVVAGDGAHGDDLLYGTTGIATDGTNLYTAGNQGLAKLTTTPRVFAPPASGPVMDSGKVTGFDPAVSSAGVAVLNGFAYTVVGSKVVKYDLAAGAAATALPVAGGDVYSCADAGNGGQARFHTGARVIGTDGSLIYIADTSCGLKAVTPSTGASRTISARFTTESTIAGRYLYTLDTYKQIWRYDLQSGQTTRLFESLSLSGAIAADNDALWVFNNSDVKLYRLAFNGAETKTFPLPNGSVTATRPAGDHIYYTDSRNLLSRISKIDGGLQVVAGDGAHGDDLLYGTTGIATDGTNLYTAGNQGLAKLTTIPRRFEEPAASAPVEFGDVRPVGPAVSSAGVAVLNGFAYTVVGSKVVKYDLAAGAAATALPVAGGDVYSCADAGNGGQARFHTGARVIGTDGSLIYIADTSCGLKAVTPSTGASRTISARFTTESTIAGRYLYTLDTYKQIWRYDLQSGQTTRLFESLSLSGAIAADNDALWVFNNSDVKLYRLAFNGAETKTFPLPNGSVTATRPAGDHIYYTDSRNLLSRISKIDGSLRMVAGDGARTGKLLFNTSGITNDGTFTYLAGDRGISRVTNTVPVPASPAAGPVLESGKVTQYGPDNYAAGVTIIDGYAYVGMGYKLVKYNLKDGADTDPELVAGGDSYGCVDAENHGQVRFNQAHVIGKRKGQIYVTDPACGLRSVNPEDGATRKVADPVSRNSVIVNNNLYSTDASGRVWQYNLDSGAKPTRILEDITLSGPLAADNNFLWGFNSSGKFYGLSLDGIRAADREFAMPANAVFAALSIGNFVYFVDGRQMLSRISKLDGSLQIVAGDGRFDDDLLYLTMGIAADGPNIYTAGDRGMYVISSAERWFAPPIGDSEGPELGAGTAQSSVTHSLTGDRSGIAVSLGRGQFVYTASGPTVSMTAINSGDTISLTEGGRTGCTDGGKEEATFSNASIVGTDGPLVYVFDSVCGLRAVNPKTGNTRTLRVIANERSSIADEYLYTLDSTTLYQYGLKSGVTRVVQRNIPAGSLMATDGSIVWLLNGEKLTRITVKDSGGRLVGQDLGSPLDSKDGLPYPAIGTHATVNGGFIYYLSSAVNPAQAPTTGVVPALRVTRTDKYGNTSLLGNAWPGVMRGITVTRNDVYALSTANGLTGVERIHEPGLETPGFDVDLTLYIEEGTRFVPKGDEGFAYYLPGAGSPLVWDPDTGVMDLFAGRCVEGCQGITFLAKQLAAQRYDSPTSFLCYFDGAQECNTAEEWERAIVYYYVDKQGFYDHDGNLLPEKRIEIMQQECGTVEDVPAECSDRSFLEKLSDNKETIAEVVETILDLLEAGNRPDNECTDSFRADTRVLMADGSTAAIRDIRTGQQVMAGDPVGNAIAGQIVTEVHINTDTELTDLTLADGSVVHTTAHHPFWVPERQEWIDAQDLSAGISLSSADGGTVSVSSIEKFTGSMTMYNLTVDRLHTYYVLAGNSSVLVHNGNCLGSKWGVPNRPGVYTIKMKDGTVYIGSARKSMRERVNAAGDEAAPGRKKHALENARYKHDDVESVTWEEMPPTFGSFISRDAATLREQARIDEKLAEGVVN